MVNLRKDDESEHTVKLQAKTFTIRDSQLEYKWHQMFSVIVERQHSLSQVNVRTVQRVETREVIYTQLVKIWFSSRLLFNTEEWLHVVGYWIPVGYPPHSKCTDVKALTAYNKHSIYQLTSVLYGDQRKNSWRWKFSKKCGSEAFSFYSIKPFFFSIVFSLPLVHILTVFLSLRQRVLCWTFAPQTTAC